MLQSTLRSTAAAASLLLASVGAVLVATPASAQTRAVVAQAVAPAQIERFVVQGSLERGSIVRYRLHATPGGEAWVAVPGQPRQRLAETRPGVYEATYSLHRRDDPDAFTRAVATFDLAGQHLSARAELASERHGSRDDRPPQISDVTPGQGERVSDRGWTRITARVDDRGTGVQSVLLRVDGRDVSSRMRIEDKLVRYAEDLPQGRHNAELVVRDRAGNTARRSWSFEVAERDHRRHHDEDRNR